MTRRELLKVANAIALAQLPGTMSIVTADSAPTLAILEIEGGISERQADALKQQFEGALKSLPPFDRIKLVVLGNRQRLTFFDAQGDICSKEIIREFLQAYTVK